MVSKEDTKCNVVSNSDESDCETAQSHSFNAESGTESGKSQVKKRNKALQVRFTDICEAQNEHRRRRSRSISCKVRHRKYMTMPARRSIPNVTKSTGVQTSPDLTKRYKTFPFERKKGHTFKHTALVENYKGQNNGFLSDIKTVEDGETSEQSSKVKGKIVCQTKVLLHHTDDSSDTEDILSSANCLDGPSCPESSQFPDDCHPRSPPSKSQSECHVPATTRSKHKGKDETDGSASSSKRQLASDGKTKGSGPVAWNSLTHVESLGSPSMSCKRKKSGQLSEQLSQTLPHSAKCSVQSQGHCRTRHSSASSKLQQTGQGGTGFPTGDERAARRETAGTASGDSDIKAQLQAMETLINSSQETIKVLLGVIQELEKGEAQREGLTYRTGQDTANCDTCRNSACIIYSVELDFKLQEDKLQPLMKRLCPSQQYPALPYPNEVFTSTPKRKSKSESKKHARWKLWFL
ncbi:inhibitory synaptic factor 2A [Eucyclogobius newberryi]|uniref:inhibitory synaptic factor 2A n=1 Tax=Eucyclogobius newberryi TaxID=166745 RepID=UPI003B5C887A